MLTVVLVVQSCVVLALVIFVVALLRSHADILRRLMSLESPEGTSAPRAGDARAAGQEAPDIMGLTLAGDTVRISFPPGSPLTLLAFLTTGCSACAPLWSSLDALKHAPGAARVVVIAKGAAQESQAGLAELAPEHHELIMSSQAWQDYAVPASPHVVLVDGRRGQIAGRGTGMSWEQIASMIQQAGSDAVAREASRTGASTTAARADHADDALVASGIGPGHPSLHPAEGDAS